MAYWLLKTEPSSYSFADLQREGEARWDGVANPQDGAQIKGRIYVCSRTPIQK